jgi:thiol-disulfide isomerase/thioredoxin
MPALGWFTKCQKGSFVPVLAVALIAVSVATGADVPASRPGAVMAPGTPQASQPAASQPAGPPPKFRCDQKVFEFGDVWGGDKVEHAFVVHNDGEGALTLEAKGTCGCTVVQFDKSVAPGAEGKVNAVLTTGAYSTTLKKSIVVTTNDPENKTVNLTLSGSTKQRITSEPALGAYFGQLTPTMQLTKTFKLTNNTDTAMKIEVVPPSTPTCFKVTSKEIEAGKIAEVTVTAEPPFNEDTNSAQFRIRTGIEKQPEMVLPCSLVKPPTLQVSPPIVRIPQTPLASPYQAPIQIRNNGEEPIKVTSVECNDSKVNVKLTETAPGKLYTATVEVPTDFAPDPAKQAVVTIKTDYKDKPIVTVPLISMISPRAATTRPQMVTAESLLGQPAPAMTGQTPDGQQIKFGNGTNQVTVINFWASWCTQSRNGMPRLDDLYQKYRRKGVEFVNVNVEQLRPAAEVAQAAKELDSKIPVVIDANQAIAKAYGVSQFPTLFLVGKNGMVEVVRRGIGRNAADIDDMIETLSGQLDKLLEGKNRNDFSAQTVYVGATCAVQAYSVPPNASTGGPFISVDAMRFDAGLFKPKSQGQYRVYFRNSGGAPLEIKAITAASGLKVEPSYTKSLTPGATGFVDCSFETPVRPEAFIHQLSIESNDAVRPMLNVAIAGQSKPLVEVQPASGVDFSNQVRSFSVPRLASLVYNGSGTIEYKTPQTSSPKFEAELITKGQSTMTILKVTAKPPFDQGLNVGTITIETNQPDQPVVQVPVKLTMPHRIEVNPATILIGSPQVVQQFTATIVNSGDKPLNILEIKKSKPEIQTQFFPEPDGLSFRLQITIPVGFNCAPEGETITVRTDDPEYKEIVIPVRLGVGSRARLVRPTTTRPVIRPMPRPTAQPATAPAK